MARSRFLLRAAVTLSSAVFSAVLAGIIQPYSNRQSGVLARQDFCPLNTRKDSNENLPKNCIRHSGRMLQAGSLPPREKAKGRAHFPCAAFEICAFGAFS